MRLSKIRTLIILYKEDKKASKATTEESQDLS